MAIRAGATVPRPTHHLKLTDGSRTIGLVLCDANGNANPKAYNRAPMQRTSIKMYQGNAGPSDMEMPWSPITQTDWSGGMLNENLEEAANRYRFGAGVDTSRGSRVVLGGLATPNAPGEGNNSNWPSEAAHLYTWRRISASTLYYAVKFTVAADYTATKLTMAYSQVGTAVISITIYTDVAGSPGVLHGTVLGSSAINHPDEYLTDFVTFSFTGINLTNRTSPLEELSSLQLQVDYSPL